MLTTLRDFFRRRIEPDVATPGEAGEHALRLAAAALLFEVARADGEVKPAELTAMREGVQATFDLPAGELNELLELAPSASRRAASLYELTSVVAESFELEQRKHIVELLWRVAFADADKDAHEEHMVRKIAGLLRLPHADFIDAKLQARG